MNISSSECDTTASLKLDSDSLLLVDIILLLSLFLCHSDFN